jgi:hypothetical protein
MIRILNTLPLCVAVLLCASVATDAHATEFRAGLGGWAYRIGGSTVTNGQAYDLQYDLALHGSRRRSFMLEWDTPRGAWPDLAASYSQLGASGTREYEGGLLLPTTETIRARASFDDYDLTARYPWRWGGLRFTGGLTVKHLVGEVDIDDSGQPPPTHESYDEILPLVHVGVTWAFPHLARLVAVAHGVEAGGSSALDWRAGVEVRVLEPLLVEVAWQQKRYKVDVDDYRLDATLDGMLFRVGFLYR